MAKKTAALSFADRNGELLLFAALAAGAGAWWYWVKYHAPASPTVSGDLPTIGGRACDVTVSCDSE